MSQSRKSVFVISTILSAVLTACGGGGGGSSAPAASVVPPVTTPISTPPSSGSSTTPVTPPVVTPPVVSGPNTSPAAFGLPATTNIPDPIFRAALASFGITADSFNNVSTASILAITSMNISRDGCSPTSTCTNTFGTGNTTTNLIHDITGIENFRNLTTLVIDNQVVANINLANLTALTNLSLWQEPITSIDLSHNTKLQILGLSETSLSTADISALTAIIELDFQAGTQSKPYTLPNGTVVPGFSSLDLSHQLNLQRLYIYGDNFTSIDLSHNHNLIQLSANDNKLTSINFNGYANMSEVILYNNNLTFLDIRGTANNGIPDRLYIEGNPYLSQVIVDAANVTAINAKFATDAAGGPTANLGYFKDSTTTVTGN